MSATKSSRGALGLALALGATALLHAQCGSSPATEERAPASPTAAKVAAAAAWEVVYSVLRHPRCVNCHPAGEQPLQGDDSRAHGQNVVRGPEGLGRFALRCENCHLDHNQGEAGLPPGAPGWHLPHPAMPLVFEGRSSTELCRQLVDPAANGGRTPEEVLRHMAEDPLVLWGWEPGPGRAPIPVPHATLVEALRAWVDAGCPCPD
jgi:hypothetical protein